MEVEKYSTCLAIQWASVHSHDYTRECIVSYCNINIHGNLPYGTERLVRLAPPHTKPSTSKTHHLEHVNQRRPPT